MRPFLKRIFIFLISLAAFILIASQILSATERKTTNFKFDSNPTSLIIGHSHPETAFNDSLIPGLKNISQAGESYFYNYFKLKQVLKDNPSIKIVFIEYTNNQIGQAMDEWIWGKKYLDYRYPLYSSFMDFHANLLLIRHNLKGYLAISTTNLREKLARIVHHKTRFTPQLGGYISIPDSKVDSLLNDPDYLLNKSKLDYTHLSETNLSYLTKMIQLCRDRNTRVILIRSPLHPKFYGYANEKRYKEILKTRFSDLEYLDFSKFPLPNADFWDLEHLNSHGAQIFSPWFANLIHDGLLNQPNKQEYINHAIADL